MEINATFAVEVTARAPEEAGILETIFVPRLSRSKLFLLHTGISRSASGASVRGWSTFAPL
jgi:hypothetical protein